jgi:hypothetical protein
MNTKYSTLIVKAENTEGNIIYVSQLEYEHAKIGIINKLEVRYNYKLRQSDFCYIVFRDFAKKCYFKHQLKCKSIWPALTLLKDGAEYLLIDIKVISVGLIG